MVGVLGAYSNTRETNRRLRDLAERARTERTDRGPTLKTRSSLPKELPAEVQQPIVGAMDLGCRRSRWHASTEYIARRFRAALNHHRVEPGLEV